MTWISPEIKDLSPYLASDSIVQSSAPDIIALERLLRTNNPGDNAFMRSAFEWVRDEVAHSFDVANPLVTLTATEVLAARVGLCYAKSHLLAALLRSSGIPTGFCYQRLIASEGHVIHGLIAVSVDGVWHRLDPRGNNARVSSSFALEHEDLAYHPQEDRGEIDYPVVYAQPVPEIVAALRVGESALEMQLPSALQTL